MRKKYVNVFGLMLLALLFGGLLLAPFITAKSNPDHITFVKLSDINFIDESGQGISMTKGWMKDLLKVEWGYGSYTNATLVWDGEKLTVYLQDDSKHDGRWFALNEKILQKVGIDPDKVSIKLDTQAPAEVVKRLKADGKWFYFFIDHFTTRYVTFEASEGYVELADWSYENHAKLIEPDDTCEECAVFAPLEDMNDNGDGTWNTSMYLNGTSGIATVVDVNTSDTDIPQLVTGVLGNAIQLDGNMYIDTGKQIQAEYGWSIVATVKFLKLPSETSNNLNLCGQNYDTLRIWMSLDNKLRVSQRVDGDVTVLYSSFIPQTNKWYLIEVVWENGLQKLVVYDYETKQKIYERIWNYTYNVINYQASNFLIGKWGAVSEEYPHLIIDEFRLYENRAPSDEEIQVILNLGRYKLGLWQGNEASLPGYLNATLFCPLDSLDMVNNVTPCYLNKNLINATVYFNESTGYPKLVSGVIGNAFEFNGENNYVQGVLPQPISANQFTLVVSYKLFNTSISGSPKPLALKGDVIFNLPDYADGDALQFMVKDNASTYHTVEVAGMSNYIGEWILAIGRYNGTTLKLEVYDENLNLIASTEKEDVFTPYIETASTDEVRIGWAIAHIVVDEGYFFNRVLSDDEALLLLHINRHKTATLSAPSASFDGSQFLVNVTAQLPTDGGSYVLPAPLNAQGLTAIGTIGNFTFLDAGTAGEVSYTLPVASDLNPPAGISLLAFLYNDEIYMTGKADVFPVVATVMNLPKGVWELVNGKVVLNQIMTNYTRLIIANATGPTVVTRVGNFYADPQNNYVNLTVLSSSNRRIYFNASALSGEKVTFTWEDRKDIYPYEIYIDGKFYLQKLADKNGVLTFTYSNWSSHTFEIKEKDLVEYGWDFGVAMVLGMIGIMIIDAFVEMSNLERKDDLRKVLAAMLVAMFAVFVFSLI